MTKYTAKNERIKRAYFDYLAEADGKSESTIVGVSKSIHRFEEYTGFRDFATFRKEQAVGFKSHLAQAKTERTDELISTATLLSTLNHLKAFFKWLAMQDGYRSKIKVTDVGYFSLQDKEVRAARSSKLKDFPSIEQVRAAVQAMPSETDIQKRDRAVVALTMLTGIRIKALCTLRIKHVDIAKQRVTQYPDEVQTKFSKQIITGFFPVGEDFKQIVADWVDFLTQEKLFRPTDPLFPKTLVAPDENNTFQPAGLSRECWESTAPVRGIFEQAFKAVGLPYFNPHSFRYTLVHAASQFCSTPEEIKAWSQNVGHESVMTTLGSYGTLSPHRQCEVIQGLRPKNHRQTDQELRDAMRRLIDG